MTVLPFLKRIVRIESFRAVAILIGVLHVAFFPSIRGDRTLLASSKDVPSIMPTGAWAGPLSAFLTARSVDAAGGGALGGPNLPLLRYQYFHGRVRPLWNPYQSHGVPLAANQQSLPLYPLKLGLVRHVGLRRVPLSPGRHIVRFRYPPKTFRWGATISGLSMPGLLAFGFMRPKAKDTA
jgi:hypothetical protein